MIEQEILDRIKELAEECELDLYNVISTYEIFKTYEIIDDITALQCLEVYCQQRMTYEIRNKDNNPIIGDDYINSEDYTINYALYDIKEDEAIPYLSQEFLKINGPKIAGCDFSLGYR